MNERVLEMLILGGSKPSNWKNVQSSIHFSVGKKLLFILLLSHYFNVNIKKMDQKNEFKFNIP